MVYNHDPNRFWALAELQALARASEVELSERADTKRQELGYEYVDVIALICLLSDRDFYKKYSSQKSGKFGFLDVDAYRINYDPRLKCRCRPDEGDYIFLKLTKSLDKTGHFCVVVSLHLEGSP
jgi:hypothetical protein